MALTHRQTEILELLKKRKYAKISELAGELYVSEATVRRELAEMKKLGLLERDHGGAIILEAADEISIYVRQTRNSDEKIATARVALNKLPYFKSVFIDNSSTALALAQQMDFRHKIVVTNGLTLASELSRREDVTVLMPGGNLLYNTNSLIGAYTVRCLTEMSFNLFLGSCAAVMPEGVFESSMDQAEIKRTALHNSQKRILLVGKTKFGHTELYKTTQLTAYDAIFTNADDSVLQKYRAVHAPIYNK